MMSLKLVTSVVLALSVSCLFVDAKTTKKICEKPSKEWDDLYHKCYLSSHPCSYRCMNEGEGWLSPEMKLIQNPEELSKSLKATGVNVKEDIDSAPKVLQVCGEKLDKNENTCNDHLSFRDCLARTIVRDCEPNPDDAAAVFPSK